MTVPFSENGGFAVSNSYIFVPVQTADLQRVYIGIFDPASFNDPTDASFYNYRMEDIVPGRVPTIRRVIVVYRDIGVCTLRVTVQGVNDNGAQVSSTKTMQIGSIAATGLLLTAFFDVQLTAFRPQLNLFKAAGAGPFSIVSATLIGEVEENSL